MKMGSTMWQFRYRMRRNPWRFILPMVVLIAVFFAVIGLNNDEIEQAKIVSSSSDTIQIEDASAEQEETGTGFFSASFWLVCGVLIGWWLGKQKPSRPAYLGPNMKRWNRRRFVR